MKRYLSWYLNTYICCCEGGSSVECMFYAEQRFGEYLNRHCKPPADWPMLEQLQVSWLTRQTSKLRCLQLASVQRYSAMPNSTLMLFAASPVVFAVELVVTVIHLKLRSVAA